MYHRLLQRRARELFAELGHGNFDPVIDSLDDEFEQVFAGAHALGGVRTSKIALRRWFERLFRLFPNLQFKIVGTSSSGPPWNSILMVEWIDLATPVDGSTYENRGVHVLRLRWGKVVSIHAYLDTQVLADMCTQLGRKGHADAIMEPIFG